MEFSALVKTGNLEAAWSVTIASWIDRVFASFVEECDKFIARRALQIRPIGITVPVACLCDKLGEMFALARRTTVTRRAR